MGIFQPIDIKIIEKTRCKIDKLMQNFWIFVTNTNEVSDYRVLMLIKSFKGFFMVIKPYLGNLIMANKRD